MNDRGACLSFLKSSDVFNYFRWFFYCSWEIFASGFGGDLILKHIFGSFDIVFECFDIVSGSFDIVFVYIVFGCFDIVSCSFDIFFIRFYVYIVFTSLRFRLRKFEISLVSFWFSRFFSSLLLLLPFGFILFFNGPK